MGSEVFSHFFRFFFVFLRFFSFFFAFLRFSSFSAYSPGTRANDCNLLGKWGISLRPRLHRPRSELPEKRGADKGGGGGGKGRDEGAKGGGERRKERRKNQGIKKHGNEKKW